MFREPRVQHRLDAAEITLAFGERVADQRDGVMRLQFERLRIGGGRGQRGQQQTGGAEEDDSQGHGRSVKEGAVGGTHRAGPGRFTTGRSADATEGVPI